MRTLVLGSMPGALSLDRGQYYAHPNNRFWPLVEMLFGIPSRLPYAERVVALNAAGVGLWDVIASCERTGSLDSAIIKSTEAYNDLGRLIGEHPELRAICFNGAKAHGAFMRGLAPSLERISPGRLRFVPLPSTSPANASFTLERLALAWSILAIGS